MKTSPDKCKEILTELLRLYDWRFYLASLEKENPNQAKKLLIQYGKEKKLAWEKAREALSNYEIRGN